MRLAEQLGATPADTIDRFRSVLTSTTKPLVPTLAMLGETIVHAQDIRLPLGIRHDYPIGTLTRLAEYYQGSDSRLTRTRIKGLRLVATDGHLPPAPGRLCPHPAADHGNGRAGHTATNSKVTARRP